MIGALHLRCVCIALALATALAACKSSGKEGPDASTGAGAGAGAAEASAPPDIRVTDGRTDLVYSYQEPGSAEFKTATTLADVPPAARAQVIVTDLSLSPEQRRSDRVVYIADLRQARADGSYPVAVASRYAFERKLSGTSTAGAEGPRAGKVIVYTTAWCGVCKKTKALLRSLNVPFIEKDVEGSRQAAEELAQKAQRAGLQTGGVPVIDVGGQILQGLDEGTLKSLLKQQGLL